jgi:enoyl-CoA hydratase
MEANRLELDKPVTIAGAGPAVAGGMELVLCCDFMIMEQSTYFGRRLKVYFQAT